MAKDKPQLYHETITWAYLLLIGERIARHRVATWEAFAEQHSDLLTWKPSVLDRYYTTELLWSDLARKTFVMPDRVAGSSWTRTQKSAQAYDLKSAPVNPSMRCD